MIIEIHGAGFRNKGAELMLRTAVAELGRRIPDVRFAINPLEGPYEARCKLALNQILPFRARLGHPHFRWLLYLQQAAAPFIPRKVARLYGCLTLNQIDALVDIAGFAYSDRLGQAGVNAVQNFLSLVRLYKRARKPIVMLPQAMGPFKRTDTRRRFLKILESVDLVFARDQQSYQHIVELAKSPDRVYVAPDITLFYDEMSEVREAEESSYCCLVPNCRMLDQGGKEWKDTYVSLLTQVTREILDRSIAVQILIHDTSGKDAWIAQRVMEATCYGEVSLAESEDSLELKELIGKSLMVVGSRYHSLVAAFSKAVPSICMGWSHKYEALYRDFGCEQFVVHSDTSFSDVQSKILELLDCSRNNRYRQEIRTRLGQMRSINREMWERVCSALLAQSS